MTRTTVFKMFFSRWLFAGVLSIAVAVPATAGTFSISPLRIELDRKHSIGVLTIHNDEDAPLMIETQLVAWSQEGNEEKYLDTHDLLATPPIMQLAPKAEQIVRVAIRHVEASDSELHYRLILSEVPQKTDKNVNGLSVALRMNLPVFIAPAAAAHADLHWQAQWQKDGSLQITATNQGKAHLQIADFSIQFDGANAVHVNPSRYVLPGSTITWTVKPPASIDHHAAMTVHGMSDQGEFSAAVGNADTH
ncbi:MAG TPA: molecular chaperone [Steroidobacteraceae bacterium]|nr:molecular chaperone [Steroidobacteraceae bacterium]